MRGTASIYAGSLSDLPRLAAKAFIAKAGLPRADLSKIFAVALLSTFSTESTQLRHRRQNISPDRLKAVRASRLALH
jgi:hypothetical protein